jgi:methyl-accepting chemotaxis protein
LNAAEIKAVDRRLGALTAQAEQEFGPVGALLGDAARIISGVGDALARLGRSLHGDEALRSVTALNQAVAGITDLDAGARGHDQALSRLAGESETIAKHLETLRRIVAEITALAINGKIQAALVATAGVDFTVFTAEIGRLGILAGQQIEQAAARLSSVRNAITGAGDAEVSFLRNEAGELRNVRARIENNIAQLIDRARRAARSIDAVESKSRQVTERVARTMGELQINDITCQRIEHVRLSLRMLAEPGGTWLAGLGEDRFHRLALAVCRLQRLQLEETVSDFGTEIEALSGNLRRLSADAGDLLQEADQAFGDSHGGLFLTEIHNDVVRAVALLDAFDAAEDRTRTMIGSVSQGFRAMSADLDAIRSIDADMRVMGLNATLKCGRLGTAGQALGVVAQELRACSRRNEDSSKIIGELLKKALETARHLDKDSAVLDRSGRDNPARIMTGCVAGLSQLSAAMNEAMDHVHREAPAIAERLAGGAGAIAFHHRLRDECLHAAQTITALDDGTPLDEADFEALRRLVDNRYTMDSERIIHQRFDGRGAFAAPVQEEASLDDLFF